MSNGWVNVTEAAKSPFYPQDMISSHLMQGLSEPPFFIPLKCETDFLKAYNFCPPLKAIVGKRAKAFNTGVIQVLNKTSLKKGSGAEANSIRKVIANPNPLQNEAQFFAQHDIYIDIFGYCPILVMRPIGMPDEISAIWNIPPWLFDIEYTRRWLYQTKQQEVYSKFVFTWNGERTEIDPKALFLILDDGIGTDMDSNLTIPDSRLIGLDYPVSNIVAAYKSRNTLITKRGAIGILTNEAKDVSTNNVIPMDQGDKEALQSEFKNYGIVGQPYQIIITDANLKWQQMGFATKDLLLFEEIQEAIERLSDGFGWPVELIARGKDVTYDNKRQARKDLYHNTIIPESNSRMEQFTRAVVLPESNLTVVRDFSGVQVLQEERKETAQTRLVIDQACEKEWEKGLITLNDWRVALGMEPLQDERFNKYKHELNEETTPPNPGATEEEQNGD